MLFFATTPIDGAAILLSKLTLRFFNQKTCQEPIKNCEILQFHANFDLS
jgi:hypothetical protein